MLLAQAAVLAFDNTLLTLTITINLLSSLFILFSFFVWSWGRHTQKWVFVYLRHTKVDICVSPNFSTMVCWNQYPTCMQRVYQHFELPKPAWEHPSN